MERPNPRGRRRLAVLLAAVTIGLVAATASATPAGTNGRIAFRQFFDHEQSWGAIFSVGADGKHATQVTRPQQGTVDDRPAWAPDASLIAFSGQSRRTPTASSGSNIPLSHS